MFSTLLLPDIPLDCYWKWMLLHAGSPGGLPGNWEMLLPLVNLRRLTLAQEAAGSEALQEVLSRMPHLHSVVHHGDYAGERFHPPGTLRGPPWLQGLAQMEEDDSSDEVENWDEDAEDWYDDAEEGDGDDDWDERAD